MALEVKSTAKYVRTSAQKAGLVMDLIRGKPAKEAGLAALQEAEKRAGSGSWELLGVARVYYLSGDKPKGDLNLAAMLCTELVLLKSGRVLAAGATKDVLTADNIRVLYDVDADVTFHPRAGHLTVVPLARTD